MVFSFFSRKLSFVFFSPFLTVFEKVRLGYIRKAVTDLPKDNACLKMSNSEKEETEGSFFVCFLFFFVVFCFFCYFFVFFVFFLMFFIFLFFLFLFLGLG